MRRLSPISDAVRYTAGDIVVVPFPFSDRLAEKRRPALVVSSARLAAEGMIWLVMITSARTRLAPTDCRIADPAAAGLEADCVVRPTKIAGVEPARIARKAGRIGEQELRDVMANVRAFVAPDGNGPQ